MNLSIVYLTSRKQSCVEWFVDSLHRQAAHVSDLNIQLVFVDTRLWYDGEPRRQEFIDAVAGRFDFVHTPPKDTVWQGPRKLTQEDYFCASSARNTGCMHAKHEYLLFVDDLSVLMPGWLGNAMHAAKEGYVVCGAYKKVFNLVVEDGVAVSYDENPKGVDSRLQFGSYEGIIPWYGNALYGCSFGCPTESFLTVNGFDELLDGQGGEDTDFGLRLERAGNKIYYNINMMTLESEELHGQLPVMKRIIKKAADGGLDASWVCLNRVQQETTRIRPMQELYELREERARVLAGEQPTFINAPQHHWFDGMALSEM
jgi:hypothetical protein